MSMTTKCGKVVSEDRNKIIVRFDSIQEFIIFYANFIEGKHLFKKHFNAAFSKEVKP